MAVRIAPQYSHFELIPELADHILRWREMVQGRKIRGKVHTSVYHMGTVHLSPEHQAELQYIIDSDPEIQIDQPFQWIFSHTRVGDNKVNPVVFMEMKLLDEIEEARYIRLYRTIYDYVRVHGYPMNMFMATADQHPTNHITLASNIQSEDGYTALQRAYMFVDAFNTSEYRILPGEIITSGRFLLV